MARLKIQTLRLTGLAGLAGAILLLAGDCLLLGTFASGREFAENWLHILTGMPAWRLTAGGIIGPIGAWLYVVGFWQLYAALMPAGRSLAFGCFAGFSLSFVWLGGAFHTLSTGPILQRGQKSFWTHFGSAWAQSASLSLIGSACTPHFSIDFVACSAFNP
jgi:hypothetical protein